MNEREREGGREVAKDVSMRIMSRERERRKKKKRVKKVRSQPSGRGKESRRNNLCPW